MDRDHYGGEGDDVYYERVLTYDGRSDSRAGDKNALQEDEPCKNGLTRILRAILLVLVIIQSILLVLGQIFMGMASLLKSVIGSKVI